MVHRFIRSANKSVAVKFANDKRREWPFLGISGNSRTMK